MSSERSARGTLVSSVSVQSVAAAEEIVIASKASGDIIAVPAKPGDVVKKGQVIASLDTKDSMKR